MLVLELAVHVVPVLGAGAGAGAVSWLCVWWRQVAGAGAGCPCCEMAVRVVEIGCQCRCWVLAVRAWRVAETGCRVPLLPHHGISSVFSRFSCSYA